MRWECNDDFIYLHGANRQPQVIQRAEHLKASKVTWGLIHIMQEANNGVAQVGIGHDMLHDHLAQPA